MRRRRVIAFGCAGAVAVLIGLALLLREDPPPPQPVELDATRARSSAVTACRAVTELENLLEMNASVDRVREQLAAATTAAERAARQDPTWVGLAGGTQALKVAIENNDPQAARVGIDTVRAACARPDAQATGQASTPTAG